MVHPIISAAFAGARGAPDPYECGRRLGALPAGFDAAVATLEASPRWPWPCACARRAATSRRNLADHAWVEARARHAARPDQATADACTRMFAACAAALAVEVATPCGCSPRPGSAAWQRGVDAEHDLYVLREIESGHAARRASARGADDAGVADDEEIL